MLATWPIWIVSGNFLRGSPGPSVFLQLDDTGSTAFTWDSLMGQFFYVITLDQHVIHRRTRVINLKSQLSRSLEPTTYHPHIK